VEIIMLPFQGANRIGAYFLPKALPLGWDIVGLQPILGHSIFLNTSK